MHILSHLSIMKVEQKNSTEKSRRRISVIQPYAVGSKGARSLAVIIPAGIARQCDITTDTMFFVKADTRTKAVTLQTIKLLEDENENKKAVSAVEVSHLTATPL